MKELCNIYNTNKDKGVLTTRYNSDNYDLTVCIEWRLNVLFGKQFTILLQGLALLQVLAKRKIYLLMSHALYYISHDDQQW